VRKPEGKRQLGRPRPRLEDNIKMDLQEVGCGGMDKIEPAKGRDRWRVRVNLRVPKMRRISLLDANRLTSQEGLCCVE